MTDDPLWRLRVDLFAAGEHDYQEPELRTAVAEGVRARGGQESHLDVSIDAGTGIAGRPIIGALFWLRAGSPGTAADLGVAIVSDAAARVFGTVCSLYEVTVIPREAVVEPDNPLYPYTST